MTDLTKPQYEHGFWWWYDPTRRGWFVGCAPAFGRPSWASSQSGMAYTALTLTRVVDTYDAYRRRGVVPSPVEYADAIVAIEQARAALKEKLNERN